MADAPFLRELELRIKSLSRQDVSVLAVFQEMPEKAKSFAREELQLHSPVISMQGQSENILVPTPSVLLLDNRQVVTGAWIGMAPKAGREDRILEILNAISK